MNPASCPEKLIKKYLTLPLVNSQINLEEK